MTREEIDDIIDTVIRDVSELPSRTSPEDQPEMMLVSAEELSMILVELLSPYLAPPSPSGGAGAGRDEKPANEVIRPPS